MKFERKIYSTRTIIYNSRNLLMKFEKHKLKLPNIIYNSRNLLMKFELNEQKPDSQSTTVEIY